MRKLAIKSVALSALMLAAVSLNANAAVTFQLSQDGSSVSNIQSSGFTLGANVANLNENPFDLAIGQSKSFHFLNVSFSNSFFQFGGTGSLDATLGFTLPETGSSTGSGAATNKTFLGLLTKNSLSWGGPIVTTLADGTTYQVSFSDISAKEFLSKKNTYKVMATVEALEEASVPAPGMLGLMGLGLLGFVAARRRMS